MPVSVSPLSIPENGPRAESQIRFKSESNRLLLLLPPEGDGDPVVTQWNDLWTQLKQRLTQQMTGSVRWREISEQLQTEAVDQVVEIGPGKVLTGLIKRTCKGLSLANVSTLDAIAPNKSHYNKSHHIPNPG